MVTVYAMQPTPTKRNSGPPSQFVTSQNGQFSVNGSHFTFVGTNAYWLPTLNNEQDIDNTLATIAANKIKVVRVWGFNDVATIPESGTWFQQISNGIATINNGTNGLQKLDQVIELAQKHGIYVIVSLTNNWNPLPGDPLAGSLPSHSVALVTNSTLPRNTLSNDYGGMDFYVRQLTTTQEHDQFYVNQTLIDAFKNYTTQVVSRYVNSPSVLAWELANDSRCSSSLKSTASCQTTTITRWHSTLAQHVKSIDPNHLISSGHQGFFCADCPKLFPRVVTPPPQTSPVPAKRRRNAEPVTRASLLKERKALWKKKREEQKRRGVLETGVRIRGRWVASVTKRQQDVGPGSAFDGSKGVDGEDIINIPDISFGTFQLFPDQDTYGPVDTTLPAFNQTVQTGLDWIRRQGETGQLFNKPVSLIAFGLVTQANAPFFVPFNSTPASSAISQSIPPAANQQPFGVSDQQRNDAYTQWIQGAVQQGLAGVIQYQWGQANLTAQQGSTISPTQYQSGTTPSQNSTGLSPNDGYSTEGEGLPDVTSTLQQGAAEFAAGSVAG